MEGSSFGNCSLWQLVPLHKLSHGFLLSCSQDLQEDFVFYHPGHTAGQAAPAAERDEPGHYNWRTHVMPGGELTVLVDEGALA